MFDEKNKKFELVFTKTSSFGRYSLGVMLYLMMLKCLAFCFLIMTIAVIPIFYLAKVNDSLLTEEGVSALDQISLANFIIINTHANSSMSVLTEA